MTTAERTGKWVPDITQTKLPPAAAEDFNDKANKFETGFSPKPAAAPASCGADFHTLHS